MYKNVLTKMLLILLIKIVITMEKNGDLYLNKKIFFVLLD